MLVYWSVFQKIPQIYWVPTPTRFHCKESGDGNRLVQLILETLSAVLEGSFDEGWVSRWREAFGRLGWIFILKKVGKPEMYADV